MLKRVTLRSFVAGTDLLSLSLSEASFSSAFIKNGVVISAGSRFIIVLNAVNEVKSLLSARDVAESASLNSVVDALSLSVLASESPSISSASSFMGISVGNESNIGHFEESFSCKCFSK
jgi:hypothetical protein